MKINCLNFAAKVEIITLAEKKTIVKLLFFKKSTN